MHGQNKVAPIVPESSEGLYQVREIFLTLQGEGPRSGQRAVFVRLTGCNLRCHFCDTEWDDDSDKFMTSAEIAAAVRKAWYEDTPYTSSEPLVVLTGGEPARQPIDSLVEYLLSRCGGTVQIETAGTIWRNCMGWDSVEIVVSPKTHKIDSRVAANATAFKYIISAEDEFSDVGVPIAATQKGASPRRLALPIFTFPRERIYLSPCDAGDEVTNRANLRVAAALALKHGYTLMVQLHKLAELA